MPAGRLGRGRYGAALPTLGMSWKRSPRLARSLGFVRCLSGLVALILLTSGSNPDIAAARGGAVAPPAVSKAEEAARRGALYFDQSAAWVGNGQQGIGVLRTFYADLLDVQFKRGKSSNEARMRIWLQTPDKYRVEMRRSNNAREVTTKILDGSRMWITAPDGQTSRIHGRPDGAAAVEQLQRDRKLLMGLANFLTLKGLKGPGVRFMHEGTTVETGLLKGSWLKVRRISPEGGEMIFRFGYERDPRTQALRVTRPGIVTIPGEASRKRATEHYLLEDWKRGPEFRYPGRIRAFRQPLPQAAVQDGPKPRMKRFLVAFPRVIRVNTKLNPALFAPPK